MSATASAPTLPRAGGGALRSLVRGRTEDPAWVRPALFGVLGVAALLCLWNLTISGWSNDYYAAAASAASESWKAWFFGSLDPGSFITVDKPPLSLWLMGLSARVFGFSIVQHPAPAGALHASAPSGCCSRPSGACSARARACIAAGALAITPVTVAIARVNNPDALLVLLHGRRGLPARARARVRAHPAPRAVRRRWSASRS